MTWITQSKFFYSCIFLFSFGIFLLHYGVTGQAVYGDGIGYYAHIRSWVIDGDWNYTNEYTHLYSAENNNLAEPVSVDHVQIVAVTTAGLAENHYSPGLAVLIAPFFLLAHTVSFIAHYFNSAIPVTGYSDLYQIFSGLGVVIYLVSGLWLLEKVLAQFTTDDELPKLSVLVIYFGTHLLYYGSYDVLNSHAISFFLSSLFLYVWTFSSSYQKIILMGIIAGLMTINRIQDGVLGAIFLASLVMSQNVDAKEKLTKCIVFLVGSAIAIAPLVYHWIGTFASITEHTYVRNLFNDISQHGINWSGSYFDPTMGLFTKAPLLILSALYFFSNLKKYRNPVVLIFMIFFLVESIIITIQGGWQAAAYGGRMYTSSLVFFAFTVLFFLEFLKRKNISAYFVMICAVIIGVVQVFQFVLFRPF